MSNRPDRRRSARGASSSSTAASDVAPSPATTEAARAPIFPKGRTPGRDRAGKLGRWFDARLGTARVGQGALQKVFPNHWSFLLGEVALYSFVVLVVTGIYLTFFFDANIDEVVYEGTYAPLQGEHMTNAYKSTLELSFDVKGGLLVRQMHHWAALVFLGGIVVHLLRVFFTGAFRRPREINWVIGCTLMLMALANGFAGYSLVDDQLSGTGLRIAYSILVSIPFAGPWLASVVFGGNFPGTDIIPRLYVLHILVVPAIIGVLVAAHLGILVRHKHAHFPGRGARDDNVVGERLWPTYTFKAVGLLFIVTAILGLLGGVAQINPIWLWGPFQAENVSSASQPDWYMGWLEGLLRLVPNVETRIGWFTIPNPFYAGVVIPGIAFTVIYLWPWIEARITRDRAEHHVLDRPRDVPWRTGVGVAAMSFFTVLGFAGSDDVLAVAFGLSINSLVWAFRIAVFVVPAALGWMAYRLCIVLQKRDGPLVDPEAEVAPGGDDGPGGSDSPSADGGGAGRPAGDPVPSPS